MRGEWRTLADRDAQLANQLREAGIDPAEVPQSLVTQSPNRKTGRDWRTESATPRQLTTLNRLSREAGQDFTPEPGLTKGEASDLIQALNTPAQQPEPPAKPTTSPAHEAASGPATETRHESPVDVELLLLQRLSEHDPEMDTVAASPSNTFDQYAIIANEQFTQRAVLEAGELALDPDTSLQLRDELRSFLNDESRWRATGERAAAAYWEQRRGPAEPDPAVEQLRQRVEQEREPGEPVLSALQHILDTTAPQTEAEVSVASDTDELRAADAQRSDAIAQQQDAIDIIAAESTQLPAESIAPPATIVIPDDVWGPPLTHPAWRDGTLIPAVTESGANRYITPEQAAQYQGAAAAPESVSAPDQPEPEAPEHQPGSVPVPPPSPLLSQETLGRGNYELGDEVVVPSGAKARVRANIEAVRLVQLLEEQGRDASPEEQAILAQWSGWGATPEVFDNRQRFAEEWQAEQTELRELLGEKGFAAARATTLNAHYTDPGVVQEMWRALQRAGLPDRALIVEPGCGSGNFVGTAPSGVNMVGVEIEAVSARIAHHLYPSAQIRNHGFERNFAPDGAFSGAIGNVPFAKTGIYDPVHNPEGFSLHNQFIVKSLALTAPGGYIAMITSAHTSDSVRPEARQRMAELGDLIGAVRLPTGAFDRQAKTDVVTDVLIFRRREEGRQPSEETTLWAGPVDEVEVRNERSGHLAPLRLNRYFAEHPQRVLGDLTLGSGLHERMGLVVTARTDTPLATQLREQLDPFIDHALAAGLAFSAKPGSGCEALREPGLLDATATDRDTEILPGTLRWNEVAESFEQFNIGSGWNTVNCRGAAKQQQWRLITDMGQTILELNEVSRDPSSQRADRDALRDRLNSLYDQHLAGFGPVNRFKLQTVQALTDDAINKAFDEKIAKWRSDAGKAEARENGLDPAEARSHTGEVPAEIREQLYDEASTPRSPRKVRSHLEGAIARDPRLGMVLGAEDFTSDYDGSNAVAVKGPIFTEDVTPFTDPAVSAETAEEAAAISFDETGEIRPERMAELLGMSIPDTLAASRGTIFPSLDDDHRWEFAATFLSGHIRDKLTLARQRVHQNPARYDGVVEALEAVMPTEVEPANIRVRPGATWVPTEYYRQFLAQEFKLDADRLTTELDPVSGQWSFSTEQNNRHVDDIRGYPDPYGSRRISGVEIFNMIANNKPVVVNKTADELEANPNPSYHLEHTAAARAAATQLQQKFADWLWADGDRYLRLKNIFNEKFNSFVKPVHSAEYKTYPGLNPKYRLYAYQARAVQRYLNDETILLDHVVGAGKTLTITVSAMEAKRLGQVRQPWIVVPNHLLGQWANEARDAYPNAKILVGTDMSGPQDRQRFIGQTAAADWDLVIVPQSVFTLIGMKREAQIEYLENEITDMRQALDAANQNGADFTVKQIERSIRATEDRITKIIEQTRSDEGLTFEQSGCDSLWVDEAHEYKNLTRASASRDLAVNDGSQRASDLEMKARYLRAEGERRNAVLGRPNAPVKALAFATGTPVSNSLSELWVMNKYLRPDLLADAGLGRIDNWAQTFAESVTKAEMNVTGTKLRMVTRMAEYANVPQLVAMVDQFRDVVTRDDIPVRLPAIASGQAQSLEFDMPQEVLDFMADLDDRLADLKTEHPELHEQMQPTWDNTLKIATDGRNATMHPRLAGLSSPPPEKSRVEAAADYLWKVHTDNTHLHAPADKHGPAVDGVFQLVFCDRGTPKPGDGPRAQNVYTELRDALIARGMAKEQIAFLHDAKTAKAKTQMIEACRDGRIRVLITSTRKGGTGLNAQRLLKTVLNMDAAWTAADMEQRIGRGIRQGNVNDDVNIVNLVARRSYDATMYQVVERKANAVAQIRSEDLPPAMEDIGADLTLSWAQTKAAATGDQVYIKQVEADQNVETLEARQKAVDNANAARRASISALRRSIQTIEKQLPGLQDVSGQLTTWSNTDRDHRYWQFNSRAIADSDTTGLVTGLRESLTGVIRNKHALEREPAVATIAEDSAFTLSYNSATSMYGLSFHGRTRYLDRDKVTEIMRSDSAVHGMLKIMRNMAGEIPSRADAMHRQLKENNVKLAAAMKEPEAFFTEADELEQARLEAQELRLEVNARENSPEALTRQTSDVERRRSQGQYRGWSRDLNPTEGWAEARGTTREQLSASVPQRMADAKNQWEADAAEREQRARTNPWQATHIGANELRYGYNPETGKPGARTSWRARQWHWQAWNSDGDLVSGAANTQGRARSSAEAALHDKLKIPAGELTHADLTRESLRRYTERQAIATEAESSSLTDSLRAAALGRTTPQIRFKKKSTAAHHPNDATHRHADKTADQGAEPEL
ncbi:hypothetical protein AS9A_P20089 (plasmid) [Hoyosella subflava DQS3-9A1]|uniref:Helicase C-terminal domain-containing protein n=2 Tax=Hoyosella TaxID=697025 RepID=F6ESL2_HOYSD|nr:hypothetical protein AS9A_P20089 [Hoyosella subflava DQS3-9A1]